MFLQKKRLFVNSIPSEERNEQAEEPDQRQQSMDDLSIARRYKRRCLLVLLPSFPLLLLGFLCVLLAHTIVILFVSIVLVSLAYRFLNVTSSGSARYPPL